MAKLPDAYRIQPGDSPYIGAMKVALGTTEEKRLSAVERRRQEKLRKLNPVQHVLLCQLCGCWMPVKETKKKDSFTAYCPLCRLRVFFHRDSWLNRERFRKAAVAMNK